MKTKTWTSWGLLTAWLALAGCAGGSRGYAKSPSPPPPSAHGASAESAPSPSIHRPFAASAHVPASEPSAAMDREEAPRPSTSTESTEPAPSASERPGLGTEWGETRDSHVRTVSFDRADDAHPAEVLSLYYNDREGARAMSRWADYREVGDARVSSPFLGISVTLTDASGRPLPAFFGAGRTYAIGEAGERYSIVVTNRTGVRVEAVASVDGLDVFDGKNADFGKRGYLVPAWGSVEIDGFRRSDDQVAAFRFGSVRDSYAARTGSDRNVGVIGVAVFPPRDAARWPWTEREIERRRTADPFPRSYASPPPPRW